ncbi:MAG: hypothetical protein J3Q66DRAFT_371667 [Benniella sp.]|nr:MAG: hypothetical protein J3Q66DRAFT_371667 [Benniella sp.]
MSLEQQHVRAFDHGHKEGAEEERKGDSFLLFFSVIFSAALLRVRCGRITSNHSMKVARSSENLDFQSTLLCLDPLLVDELRALWKVLSKDGRIEGNAEGDYEGGQRSMTLTVTCRGREYRSLEQHTKQVLKVQNKEMNIIY